ncbi:hypothetical protein QYE76_045059 [Lolium multiflorum]|uniref:F-box domain-containing protein n=1 Tax=Lolium multiflorum TaxID=4521 RepID=A0AAD8WZF7_LOLMU|nr:hypothetical protein QYE76_045059 [Lolium multiflorum]
MASASSSSRIHRRQAQAQAEEAQGSGQDLLMSLPPEMLDNILRRLPFDKLVRTCCLNPAWHHRWESIPNLDIWFSAGSNAAPDARVLWRCAAPIRSFTARVRMPHFYRAAHWLQALACKRVKKLILKFDNPWFSSSAGVLGPALFACRELTHLELCGYCHLPRAPHGFGGFPNLVTLLLNHVAFPFSGGAAQLEHLISSAVDLTELSLNDVKTSHFNDSAPAQRCAIRAPKLRVLKLIMFFDNGCRLSEEFPLLEEAIISIDDLFWTPDYINTFRRIRNAKRLLIETDSIQINENPLQGISWKFQNLRVGHLSANFGKLPSIMSIFSLLRSAPHIEELHIEVEITKRDDENDEDFATGEIDDPESDDAIDEDIIKAEISDDLFANLKHVSLNGIKCLPNDIWFMKFVLSKTRLLESFIVTFGYRQISKSYLDACTELAMCQKVSPQAKLMVRLGDEPDSI